VTGERQRLRVLVLAVRGHEIRHLLAEDVLGVLRPSTARGAVQRVDRLAVVGGHDAARVEHGLRRERIFRPHAEVHLARVRRADVVAFVLVLSQVALDVGARRHGLRLQRLDLSEGRRIQLVRHHAAQVVFDRQFVDGRQGAPAVGEHLEGAAIRAVVHLDRRAARLHAHVRAARHDEHRLVVERHGHAVAEIGLLQRP
jgi:hypothetical protein